MVGRTPKTMLGFRQGSVAARQRSPLDLFPGARQADKDGAVLLKGAQHGMRAPLAWGHTVEDDFVPGIQQDADASVGTARNEPGINGRPIILLIGTVEY